MDLIIKDKIITEPIENIIYELKRNADWNVFDTIVVREDYLSVTCPFHKDGTETHPSCSIYTNYDSLEIMPGTFHCFTCDAKGTLIQLIASVLGYTDDEAITWLLDRYGTDYNPVVSLFDKPWDLDVATKKEKQDYLDPCILSNFAFYHPYLSSRKISYDTAVKFSVGYNKVKGTITFPVWDVNNNLVMITERSIKTKHFYIPKNTDKPVYLLNFIKGNTVYITESQIDALTLHEYGYPAVALFGTGSKQQYDILKSTGISNYVLCFDGDSAGRKGAEKFIRSMPKNVFITTKILPEGKDVNDLTKEEFDNLMLI